VPDPESIHECWLWIPGSLAYCSRPGMTALPALRFTFGSL
jgi:hypothetical protein